MSVCYFNASLVKEIKFKLALTAIASQSLRIVNTMGSICLSNTKAL